MHMFVVDLFETLPRVSEPVPPGILRILNIYIYIIYIYYIYMCVCVYIYIYIYIYILEG